jgi:NDP-sugar pyrophosphorylase family protein
MKDNPIQYSIYLKNFLSSFPDLEHESPWSIVSSIQNIILQKIKSLSADYKVKNDVAIHKTAKLEEHVIIKGPTIISAGCFVAAHAYMRGGIFIGDNSVVGPGCEIKSSLIMSGSAMAHFNFVGDSLMGSFVNMEAGSIIANHFNERLDKTIHVVIDKTKSAISATKFGAVVGDHSKIGANAVLTPGTILTPESIVKRLQLVDQNSAN